MGKSKKGQKPVWAGLACGAALSLAGYLATHLLLAALMVGGRAGEEAAFPLTAAFCALASFAGGLYAARTLRTFPAAAVVSGALFYLVLAVIGALWRGSVAMETRSLILLACALAGGTAAGLMGNRRKRSRRRSA